MSSAQGITRLLNKWHEGDEQALDHLTTLVYDELRRLAANYLRHQQRKNTLQATALVHEAYLELLGMQDVEWKSRAHFIGIAAQAMRYILIDHARQQAALKRGGGLMNVSLSRAERVGKAEDMDLVALGEVFREFETKYPRQAKVIELHFFGGLKVEEIPDVLSDSEINISRRTVERDLTFARAWLLRAIQNQ